MSRQSLLLLVLVILAVGAGAYWFIALTPSGSNSDTAPITYDGILDYRDPPLSTDENPSTPSSPAKPSTPTSPTTPTPSDPSTAQKPKIEVTKIAGKTVTVAYSGLTTTYKGPTPPISMQIKNAGMSSTALKIAMDGKSSGTLTFTLPSSAPAGEYSATPIGIPSGSSASCDTSTCGVTYSSDNTKTGSVVSATFYLLDGGTVTTHEDVSATIDQSSLSSNNPNPVLSGTATTQISGSICVQVAALSGTGGTATSAWDECTSTPVANGRWSLTLKRGMIVGYSEGSTDSSVPSGSYKVTVSTPIGGWHSLATGTLIVR